jgi:hypothetical protein
MRRTLVFSGAITRLRAVSCRRARLWVWQIGQRMHIVKEKRPTSAW